MHRLGALTFWETQSLPERWKVHNSFASKDLSCAAEKLDLPKEAETWGNGRIQDHFFQQHTTKILSFAMGMHDRLVLSPLDSLLSTSSQSVRGHHLLTCTVMTLYSGRESARLSRSLTMSACAPVQRVVCPHHPLRPNLFTRKLLTRTALKK